MHFYLINHMGGKCWIKLPSGLYQATDDIYVYVRDETGMHYEFHILPGFQTDGGSVPWCFRWFVPKWTEDNVTVNLAYAIHDGLYASELMHRSVSDDLLRGLLRDGGLPRYKASTVCFAVNNFAASHYGKDRDYEENRKFFRMRVFVPQKS